ncbi:MAG: hypothetical protein ACETWE_13315 [Candidatus Bathyarchaeia archaeon]
MAEGRDVKELYEAGQHEEIEKHLKQDLKITRWLDLCGVNRLIGKYIKHKEALFDS